MKARSLSYVPAFVVLCAVGSRLALSLVALATMGIIDSTVAALAHHHKRE
jgi:hypothetical protein